MCFYFFQIFYNLFMSEKVWNEHKISKIAILGYGMLEAGLTVQSIVDAKKNVPDGRRTMEVEYKRIYCPQYLALASAQAASLDGQLQIAGRTFVELKNVARPENWKIQFLGVDGMLEKLVRYSSMETRLAKINSENGQNIALYQAMKQSFGARLMAQDALGSIGVVGVRRGDFGSILGLTPAAAAKRALAAEKARERALKEGVQDQEQIDEFAEEEYRQVVEEERQQMEEEQANQDDNSDERFSAFGDEEVEGLLDETANQSTTSGSKRPAPPPSPPPPPPSSSSAPSSSNSPPPMPISISFENTTASFGDLLSPEKRTRVNAVQALRSAPNLHKVLHVASTRRLKLVETIFEDA